MGELILDWKELRRIEVASIRPTHQTANVTTEDELLALSHQKGWAVSRRETKIMARRLGSGKVPIAITYLPKVWIGGVRLRVSPTPIGIFDVRPAPIMVLTDCELVVAMINPRKARPGREAENRKFYEYPISTITSISVLQHGSFEIEVDGVPTVQARVTPMTARRTKKDAAALCEKLRTQLLS